MKNTIAKCLFILMFVGVHTMANSQVSVSSLEDLLPYLKKDNIEVKLVPGTYSITSEDVTNGLYKDEVEIKRITKVLLLFSGSNSVYDFTDVTIEIETKVLQSFGNFDVSELQITGNNNVLKNLTMLDNGSVYDAPTKRATNIIMDGKNNRIEGFHVTTKGSYPYGYGDAFGKGGKTVIKHRKHSACLVRGESNHLKNSSFIHRSYGHCLFMQGANNPKIEGCKIQGEVRKTDAMLAEKGTGSPADKVDFMTVWGYTLPSGYMLSTGEAGIRAYNGGETIINGKKYKRGTSNPTILNCTIKNMRTGVTIAHATGKKIVEGCVAIGCENGFSLGSGTAVDCSADCTYGPVYSSTYGSDKKYNADITILSSKEPYYNGSGCVAYIGGSNHTIRFHGSNEPINEGLKIMVGGVKNNIRLLHGNFPHQNDFNAKDIKLYNTSKYPVFLSPKSSNIKGSSNGNVVDLGSRNNINKKMQSKKNK